MIPAIWVSARVSIKVHKRQRHVRRMYVAAVMVCVGGGGACVRDKGGDIALATAGYGFGGRTRTHTRTERNRRMYVAAVVVCLCVCGILLFLSVRTG